MRPSPLTIDESTPLECVRSLLAAMANPNILDARKRSPLFHVVQGDNYAEFHVTDTARELLQAAVNALGYHLFS